MPNIFSENVFRAVARGKASILERLKPDHFENYTALNEALEWLGPKERCDAIYGDWMDAINSPSGGTLLRMRKLLIEQGGLAANYLAEFAQNADDAYPGDSGGEIKIWANPEWLFVANNGRSLTGADLLGLCRFFANGTKIEDHTEDLIGKFGIGFKSCYRIGTEVWVHTWDEKKGSFTFRIPLCRKTREQSHFDQSTYERITKLVALNNPRSSQDELGFCTPEFAERLPDELQSFAEQRQHATPKHGTFFAVHLHEEGAEVLRKRIRDQSEQIFELCPLFVHRLRVTQLEDTSLRLIVHREGKEANLRDILSAEKVTLEAQHRDDPKSNARFWRLTQIAKSDFGLKPKPWRIALHADSNFSLNLNKEAGETTSLSNGLAYAFFPLSIAWPFNIHLHINLPTNLDRSNWNPEIPEAVADELSSAAEGLCLWLAEHQELWHSKWSVSDLVGSIPLTPAKGQSPSPAFIFYSSLRQQINQRHLIRSLWGEFIPAQNARIVLVRDCTFFFEEWRSTSLCFADGIKAAPWCTKNEGENWGLAELSDTALVNTVSGWLSSSKLTDETHRHIFSIVLSIENLNRHSWVKLFPLIKVQADLTIADLFNKPGGASLNDAWHLLFKRLSGELRHDDWAEIVVGSHSLWGHLDRFSRPTWNPDWSSIPRVLHSQLPPSNIDELWAADKEPCPKELRSTVLAKLILRDATDSLRPLHDIWVLSRTVPDAFKSLYAQVNPPRQAGYVERLQKWDLLTTYLETVQSRLKAQLPAIFAESLSKAMREATVPSWLDNFQKQQKELSSADSKIQSNHYEMARDAWCNSLGRAFKDCRGSEIVSQSVDADLRSVLAWLKNLTTDIGWLDDSVLQKLADLRFSDLLQGFTVLRKSDLPRRKSELVRSLLEIAYIWPDKNPTPKQYSALDGLALDLSKTDRRVMAVGISPRKRKGLNDFLCAPEEQIDPNAHWLRVTSDFEDKILPPHVGRVSAFREVCPTVSELKLDFEGQPTDVITYPITALPIEISELPPVRLILKAGLVESVCEHRPISLKWWDGDHLVAETERATFYYQKESRRLFVSHLEVSLEDHQIEKVLATYLQNSSQDPEVDTAWQEAKAQRDPLLGVYSRFRERIRNTLVTALVTKMGYETAHIWRELLQNAENAYASMPDPRPKILSFELEAKEESDHLWKIQVSNRGRAFNREDRDKNQRRDIDRIISLGGERDQVAEEIGRYNLGFKSVFSTTDVVNIASGGYEFQVRDLLLRYPAVPREDLAYADRPTTFSWKCSKSDMEKIFGFVSKTNYKGQFPFLSPAYVLFSRYVNLVVLRFKDTIAELRVERTVVDDAERVITHNSSGAKNYFRVIRGNCELGTPSTTYEFAAAIRTDERGIPSPAKNTERYFHLIYPTEERSFVPFIIHADFEAAGLNRGQLKQQSRRNLFLIISATRLVFEYALKELNRGFRKDIWQGWVRVLSPMEFSEGIKANYEDGFSGAIRLADEIKTKLLEHVPHQGEFTKVASLRFPSSLMRKFSEKHGALFEIETADWLDDDLSADVKLLGHEENLRLHDWVGSQFQDESRLTAINEALQDFSKFTPQERFEINSARDAASHRLQKAPRIVHAWNLDKVVAWWSESGGPITPYVLEGDLFPWMSRVGIEGNDMPGARRFHISKQLTEPATERGKEAWYRMFTFACLMSAGYRVEDTHRFLKDLETHRIFENTADSNADFNAATAQAFDALVHREQNIHSAAGENAHFWRRIFYDARKVHHLIYQNDFAEVFLSLCNDPNFGEVLPQFLRSGQLPGQRPWQGVIGQSAAGPLLFIIRELRRLQIIKHDKADPYAFFACKPVRRVCAALEWIDERCIDNASFEDMLKISRKIHDKYLDNADALKHLLPVYDIPLLALEKSGILNFR